MADRLPINVIQEFVDGLDLAGVKAALQQIADEWISRAHTDEPGIKAEAQAWLDRLNSTPTQLEPARKWLRRTLESKQSFLNDRFFSIDGLGW